MTEPNENGSATVHVALLPFQGRPTSADSAGLMRVLAARILGGDQSDWSVDHDEAGAPQAQFRGRTQPLFISLSRTDGMAAACLCREAPVGIDIERMTSHAADLSLAETFFSDGEREYLLRAGEESPSPLRGGGLHAETFFRIWTLKEAYIKARGLGFGIDLRSFSVATPHGFAKLLPPPGDCRTWSLHSRILASGHALGIAASSTAATVVMEDGLAPDQ